MKSNIKNSILFFLIAICIFLLIYQHYKQDDLEYKSQLDALRIDNMNLCKKRDSLNECKLQLQKDFEVLSHSSLVMKLKIDSFERKLNDEKIKANLSLKELNELRKQLSETQKKIEELKNHPANRKDEDLLNSLKLKLK